MPPSTGYKLRKFIRRNRTRVTAGILVLATLVAGIIGTTFGLIRAQAARREAEQEELATLESYRASTDDAIEQLIGSKASLSNPERTYLSNALKRWQAFADRTGHDQRNRVIRAKADFRMALIWDTLGQHREATSAFESAIALWNQLALDFPRELRYSYEAAHSQRDLSLVLRDLGLHTEAETALRSAQPVLKELVLKRPENREYRQEFERNHECLGNCLLALSKMTEAEAEFLEAIDIQEMLVADFPDVAENRLSMATCRHGYSRLLNALRRPEEETQLRAALALFEQLAEELPSVIQSTDEMDPLRERDDFWALVQRLEKAKDSLR